MIFEIIRMSFESLLSNKVRTFLSMLGIIIGVSTVISVVGIGLGAQKQIEEQYENLSVNSIMVMPARGTTMSKLSAKDVPTILEEANFITDAAGIIQGTVEVASAQESGSYSAVGMEPEFVDIAHLKIESGRSFDKTDEEGRAKMAILGSIVAEDLFEGVAPKDIIGKTITISKRKIEIVGVLKSNGSKIGPISYDDSVFTPYSTAEKNILGDKGRVFLMVLADSVDSISLAMDELIGILRDAHKLRPTAPDDFRLRDAGSMVASAQESSATMTFLLTSVAIIVLLVSGIGIMNVMFVTVSERTKEIGILKAIGAKQKNILLQFLIESIVLTVLGGLFGVVLGQLSIPLLEEYGAIHSVWGSVLGFGFSVFVGVFFGFYPAWQGSRLDPVDALRSE